MKKWKQRGFAFVLALSLTTGMLTGAQAAVSKETLNEAVQDTAEYMYRTVQNPPVSYTHLDVYKRQPRRTAPADTAVRSPARRSLWP